MPRARSALCIIALGLMSYGCHSPKPKATYRRPQRPNYENPLPPGQVALQKITNPAELPYFGEGFQNRDRILEAIAHSRSYFDKPSSRKYYPYLDITHDKAKESLDLFKTVLMSSKGETEFHEQVLANFDVYRSVGYNGQGTVLYTAYCEPIYEGSLKPGAEFRYPLYRLPADLVKDEEGTPLGRRTEDGKIVPYYTRAEIEEGNLLAGQELVYLKSKLEAYIVHVQGSARLKLPDGTELRVGYAGKTDHPYTSVGQALIRDKKMTTAQLSLCRIKDHFARHPEELDQYLHQNESFVFFTETDGGPYGSIGVPVTPYRSIATDKTVFPRGCIGFVKTTVPFLRDNRTVSYQKFRSFALDQDTGGAIRSAGRADLFIGTGPVAEFLAGRTQAEGNLYYIFVKAPAELSSLDAESPVVPEVRTEPAEPQKVAANRRQPKPAFEVTPLH